MILRIFKWIGIFLFLLIASATSYIIISGNHYLFFTIQNTVLKGRLGPSIDEYQIYSNREVNTGRRSKEWPIKYIGASFTDEELAYHNKYETAAFAIFKRDTLVFEYYDEGYSDSSYTNSWSMAKSIVSLLVGAAIDEGLIESEEVLLSKYYPRYKGSGIKLKHLLSMSSGINFDESYINPFAHSARGLYGSDLKKLNDRYKPVSEPGKVFDYQGGNTVLLAMLLEQVTGTTLSDYASKKLWQPIHAEHPAYWSLDREGGLERAFCCFNSNVRDFGRIGKLMLHNGVWDYDTLISPSYIKKATQAADLKLSSGSQNQKYGYQWWVLQIESYQGMYARGIQGQYIVIIPEEDLVVVRLGKKRPGTEYLGHSTDMLKYVDMARRMTE